MIGRENGILTRVLPASIALLCIFLTHRSSHAETVVWANGATHFGHECKPPLTSCTLASVKSPDGQNTAIVRIEKDGPIAEIRQGKTTYSLNWKFDTEVPFIEMEILWSPDSSAVSFAWNDTAVTQSSRIYNVSAKAPRQVNLHPVMKNFADIYPPCVGDPAPCRLSQSGEDYNYLTLAWSSPHTLVLMAEVPSTSSSGRNLGQLTGYEVNATTGRIVNVMGAGELKRYWQKKIGWNLRIPERP